MTLADEILTGKSPKIFPQRSQNVSPIKISDPRILTKYGKATARSKFSKQHSTKYEKLSLNMLDRVFSKLSPRPQYTTDAQIYKYMRENTK